jgi:hypothetical protein
MNIQQIAIASLVVALIMGASLPRTEDDPVEPFEPAEAPGPDAIQINSHDGAMQHG